MCGICGYSGAGNEKILQNMTDMLRHRGPDEGGILTGQHMNLGSRRLNIIGLKEGKQPMWDSNEQVCIVWNGEIYNWQELKETLEEAGHHFKTSHCDTEVLLHMYLEYRENFVEKLNGMFAIALWDKQKKTLFLYRDRLGVKPLYYTLIETQGESLLIFASEIKALFAHPLCKKELNDESIYQYFSYKNCLMPKTAYKNIFEIIPGQYAVFCNGSLTFHTYWNLNWFYEKETIPFEKENAPRQINEITEHLESLLFDAVKLRLKADVEVGAFLSGGLDSSLVCAMAAKEQAGMTCFTLGHHSIIKKNYDKAADVAHADKLSELLGLKQELLTLRPADVIQKLERILFCFDEPFSGPISTYMLAETASKKVKTVLSGDGADEIFGGYLPHMLSFPMEYYCKIKNAHSGNFSISDNDLQNLCPMENDLPYLNAMYQFSQGNEDLLSYRMLLMTDEEKQLFLGERLYEFAANHLTLQQVKNDRIKLGGRDVLNRNLEYDSLVLLPSQVLKYTDRLSMAHSLEVRSPFLDYRLAEYMAGISGRYKLYQGQTKYLLRRAASKYLPESFLQRKKEGFVMPINDWLQKELKDYVLDTLSAHAVKKHGYFNPAGVYFLLKKYYDDPDANSGIAGILWNFVCFQKWFTL